MQKSNSDSSDIQVARFPMRRSFAIWLSSGADAWIVQAHSHVWEHGNIDDAFKNAAWLANNFGWPIRTAIQSS